MKMKNVLMILISLAVVISMAGAVSAETTISNNGKTEITYEVPNSYVVIIPDAVSFGDTLSSSGVVNATKVLVEDNWKLIVNMTSQNGLTDGNFTLNYGSTLISKIPYSISCNDRDVRLDYDEEDGFVVLEVLAGARGLTGESSLSFATNTDNIAKATMSGIHTDLLTFICDVVPRQ